MVKHQRRSHQRGLISNDLLDDCTSDSESGESPPTPTQSTMSWPAPGHLAPHSVMSQGHPMHRAASFPNFQVGGYQQVRQGALGEGQDYHHEQHGVPMMQRSPGMSQHFYLIEQTNPGVATMNTAVVQHPFAPRQPVDRPPIDMSYSGESMTSLSSSPGNFSSASGHSPSMPESMYTHQAPQSGSYGLPETSPVEQTHPMVPYTQPISQAQTQTSHPESEAWYQYQAPVEVATIGQLPPYGSGLYDLYGPKLEFNDPTMQLPSSRIETM